MAIFNNLIMKLAPPMVSGPTSKALRCLLHMDNDIKDAEIVLLLEEALEDNNNDLCAKAVLGWLP